MKKFKCAKCGDRKLRKFFPLDRTRREGIKSICKRCHCRNQSAYYQRTKPVRHAYARLWYSRNKKHVRRRDNERRLRLRARDPVAFMIQRVKVSAKERGLPFDLKRDDLKIPYKCPVLGMKLVWPTNLGHRRPRNMPTIDRVDPQKGYVRGNVKVISSRANMLKNNATLEELKALVRYVEAAKAA